jgi:hypothetical protein
MYFNIISSYLEVYDIFYNFFNISKYLFFIIFLILTLGIFFIRQNTNLNYNQIMLVNNFNIDKLLNSQILSYIFKVAHKINFLLNNKLLAPMTYLKLLVYKL